MRHDIISNGLWGPELSRVAAPLHNTQPPLATSLSVDHVTTYVATWRLLQVIESSTSV